MLNGEWQNKRVLSGEIQKTIIDTSGEPQEKVVKPSVVPVVVEPDNGKRLVKVTVEAVSSDIDVDIRPEDIREGVEILGVVGTLEQRENLDTELNEQDALLDELQGAVDVLPEKPYDRLQWKCDNMKTLSGEFSAYSGESLENVLKGLKTDEVTSLSNTFSQSDKIKNLDLRGFNTSNVTNMFQVFRGCSSLTNLDVSNWETSKVTTVNAMFNGCKVLKSLDLSSFNTKNVESFSSMFYNCSALESILGEIDMLRATNNSNMFQGCKALETVTLKNIKISLQIGSGTSYGTLLTDATIVNTFQELHDLTGSTAKTLTLSTPSNARTEAIYVKLIDVTDEMRTEDPYIDSKKPCVVCESTDEGAMTLKEYGISKNWNIA